MPPSGVGSTLVVSPVGDGGETGRVRVLRFFPFGVPDPVPVAELDPVLVGVPDGVVGEVGVGVGACVEVTGLVLEEPPVGRPVPLDDGCRRGGWVLTCSRSGEVRTQPELVCTQRALSDTPESSSGSAEVVGQNGLVAEVVACAEARAGAGICCCSPTSPRVTWPSSRKTGTLVPVTAAATELIDSAASASPAVAATRCARTGRRRLRAYRPSAWSMVAVVVGR